MKHLRYILFLILSVAVILYPAAMAGNVVAAPLTGNPTIAVCDQVQNIDLAAHNQRHGSLGLNHSANVMQNDQSLSGSILEAIPCCADLPNSNVSCVIITAMTPGNNHPGQIDVEPRVKIFSPGISPGPLPHPPKVSS